MLRSEMSVRAGLSLVLAVTVTLAAAGYVGLCLWLAAHQREMMYTLGGARATPAEAGGAWLTAADIHTEDGERLDAWWSPPPPGKGVIIFFHGTPGTLVGTVSYLAELRHAGFGVLAIDYRGYGGSTGRPSEAGLRADARAAFDFVRTAAPQAPIALFGESLGTGVAVGLAGERKVAGLLLNSPFASLAHHFAVHLPPLPYRLILTERFDSEAQIASVRAPVMILAGTADDVTVIGEARRLFAAAHEPKQMIEVEGVGHCAAWSGDAKTAALAALAEWTAPASPIGRD